MRLGRSFAKVVALIMDVVEIHGASLFLFTIFVGVFTQVIMRYLLKKPSPELFEITQYAFPWGTLLGAAFAHRYRDHIRFNIIYEKLPRSVRLSIDIVFDAAVIVLFALSLRPVLHYTFWYHMFRSEVLSIPWTYLVFCLPIFMVLVIIHNLEYIYYAIREFINGKPRAPKVKRWL